MGDRIIATAGKLVIHALHALLVCWKRMLRLGLSVGALAGFVTLVFGALVTHDVPPGPLTWVVALFFGFALGYAAAMTVLADEMLLSIVETVQVLEGDLRAGLRTAAVAAEREAGEAGHGLMRFLGHKRAEAETEKSGAEPSAANSFGAVRRAPLSQPLVTVSSLGGQESEAHAGNAGNETLAAIAATDAFLTTAPRPSVAARPVRADQLPRIGWTSDEAEAQRAARTGQAGQRGPTAQAVRVATAEMPSLAEMPPLPVRTLRSPVETHPQPLDLAARGDMEPHSTLLSRDAKGEEAGNRVTPGDAVVATPTAMDSRADASLDGQRNEVARQERDDEGNEAGEESARPPVRQVPVTTRTAAVTHPIEPMEEPAPRETGIWARISSALIGNTTVPLREANGAAGSPRDGAGETGQP